MRSGSPSMGLLLALAASSPAVAAPVASIDLGSEWLKVAIVNLKPGQIPISVAINEMSKRSPALVAFHSGTRLLAEEATGITARTPDGSAAVRTDDGVVYSPMLLAMVLGYGMGIAEAYARSPMKVAVFAVQAYFGQAERKGVVHAAQLVGINVLSLINEHAGAALQYGIVKDFSNESRLVVFFDMGASSLYAALVQFSAYKTTEFGKTVSVTQFQVKDVRWNTGVGGQKYGVALGGVLC